MFCLASRICNEQSLEKGPVKAVIMSEQLTPGSLHIVSRIGSRKLEFQADVLFASNLMMFVLINFIDSHQTGRRSSYWNLLHAKDVTIFRRDLEEPLESFPKAIIRCYKVEGHDSN
ncbi:hypothetical protein V6N13_071845 [Hibiscus sabdariffa]|uniref:Uncharacterized protein n=1 Tax=Hibiscus sabdariffa TaxID=183260 RepID=A0ABR2TCJ8_9ROSI